MNLIPFFLFREEYTSYARKIKDNFLVQFLGTSEKYGHICNSQEVSISYYWHMPDTQ